VLGHRMSGGNLLKHLIIQGSSFPLPDGTAIATHDPGKAGAFGDMKPCPMGIQLLEGKGMGKNPWNLPGLPFLKAQVCIVHLGKEILRMTAIGFSDTGFGFLQVSRSQIGKTEIVRKRGNTGGRWSQDVPTPGLPVWDDAAPTRTGRQCVLALVPGVS